MASVALPGTCGIGGTGYEALHDRFHQDAARGGGGQPGHSSCPSHAVPIAGSDDTPHFLLGATGTAGFLGAPSLKRFPTEVAITAIRRCSGGSFAHWLRRASARRPRPAGTAREE